MSTTTIRLPDELKARVARAGTTPHHVIEEAIAARAGTGERRRGFHAPADERYVEILRTAKTIPWDEAREHLLERVAGKPAKRPIARKSKR